MPSTKRRKGLIDLLFFSWANNVWFGIATLVAIFVYSSLGSAIPPLRQHALLEMTEMEWFHWWPFKLLIGLMCITIVVVTIKQIPFKLINAGVWTIHAGIIILALGSVYYFSTKLEGDIPVFRRRALIEIPGRVEAVSLLVRADNHVAVDVGDDEYHFSVARIFPDWQIASGDDQGKKAFMVWIDVVTPKQTFTRQLLAGYPQYTEDILPDRTRAKKTLGKPLVDENLKLTLDYKPQTEFFLMDSAALYARVAGSADWIERPIAHLPHYHERIASYNDVIMPSGVHGIPLRPIDLRVPVADADGDPLADYNVRVTSFLRYAFMARAWRDGGERLNPVADIVLSNPGGARADYELVAFDPQRNSAEDGLMILKWVDTVDDLKALAGAAEGRLSIRVPSSGAEVTVPVSPDMPRSADDAPFTSIEGTDFSYRLRTVLHDLPMKSGQFAGRTISVVTVEFKGSDDGTFTRFVADLPEATRDVDGEGHSSTPDARVEATYQPGNRAIVTVVAGPDAVGTHVMVRDAEGKVNRQAVAPGQTVPLRGDLMLTLRSLRTHAVEDVRPRVVPFAQRERNAREMFSMVRLDLSKGDWHHSQWLEFNRYAFANEQFAVPRRMSYLPTTVALPDGRQVELMFSRQRRPLPVPIALETFDLATHTGGYTGETISIRDFISRLRFKSDDGWTEPVQMSSNQPASYGGYWYFQAEWDPPAAGYPGMSYTGLGVGNRNGVHIQLAGTCIAVAGMIFAFYVKPIIRRRRQTAGRARIEAASSEDIKRAAPEPVASGT